MNILLVGNGGREHAITWRLALSSSVNKVYVAPGMLFFILIIGIEKEYEIEVENKSRRK